MVSSKRRGPWHAGDAFFRRRVSSETFGIAPSFAFRPQSLDVGAGKLSSTA